MSRSKLQGFLDTYQNRRGESWMDKYHPSEIIADTLTQLGYC
jgi:UDP-N-acetylglucosamine 2-epimerase (non-hydrolysing)